MTNFKILSYPEVETLYHTKMCYTETNKECYFNIDPDQDDFFGDPQNSLFAVFEGDTHLSELNLTLENKRFLGGFPNTSQPQHRAVLVLGNLTVDTINMYDTGTEIGWPLYLYVKGNLIAQKLTMYDLAGVIVEGNAEIEQLIIMGNYNANLNIHGNLTVKNGYQSCARLAVKGALISDNYYLHTQSLYVNEVSPTNDQYNLKIGNISNPIIPCAKEGIKYFEGIDKIWEEELHKEEEQRIFEKIELHKIFIDDVYDIYDEVDAWDLCESSLTKNVFNKSINYIK